MQILHQAGIGELLRQLTNGYKCKALRIVPRHSWHWNEYFPVSITVGCLLFGIIPRANKSSVYYYIGRLCLPERYVHVPHGLHNINILKMPSKKKLRGENKPFLLFLGHHLVPIFIRAQAAMDVHLGHEDVFFLSVITVY